jgi:uncharacterized coiled-coil protein SlyX
VSDPRLTEIEVALSYDRRMIDELSGELYRANQEIEGLRQRVARLEKALDALSGQVEGAPPNEKPPHY